MTACPRPSASSVSADPSGPGSSDASGEASSPSFSACTHAQHANQLKLRGHGHSAQCGLKVWGSGFRAMRVVLRAGWMGGRVGLQGSVPACALSWDPTEGAESMPRTCLVTLRV